MTPDAGGVHGEQDAAERPGAARGAHGNEVPARHDTPRPTVQWIPAAYEGILVSRPLRREVSDLTRVLRLTPEQVIELAYGTRAQPDGGAVRLRLVESFPLLNVPVLVEALTPGVDHPRAAISLRWRAARVGRLFPVMEADLEARPDDAGHTLLVLEGRYRPPLGLVGLVFDHLLGRRLASATAAHFLERIARAIEADTATGES